jgi:tRNA dimethylallyltransferase
MGATASGKSDLAITLAKELDGEVITLDSVQIYKELDIGSGKVSTEERGEIPHHLLDIYPPDKQINVAEVISLADQAICSVRGRKKTPILVAGTSLYLKCLLHGILDTPGQDSDYREKLEDIDTEDLYQELVSLDPARADKLNKSDRHRIIRSLEIINSTGGARHSELIKDHCHREVRYNAVVLHVCWSREDLYHRINKRCQLMLERGLLEETARVIENYGISLPPLRTLGYSQSVNFLNGRYNRDLVLSEMQTKTRQFAKRQLTFIRNCAASLGWKTRPAGDEGEVLKSSITPAKKGQIVSDFRVVKYNLMELKSAVLAHINGPNQGIYLWHLSASSLIE